MAPTAYLAVLVPMPIFWNKPPLALAQRAKRGSLESVHAKARAKGFTLLELLIALVIISLMTAVVGFGVSQHPQRALKAEGDKLAARLNAAHAQMNAGASPLRLLAIQEPQRSGYFFETIVRSEDGTIQASWQAVQGDDVLSVRVLPAGSQLVLSEPLLIAREPITAPSSVLLSHEQWQVRVSTDGVHGWAAR